ncbi:phage tail sheath family protein [Burkholderia stagnalis]|nr:phage tail sheath C-terminal domain-containing protein [Burkholderia stagnalis]
MSSLDGWLAPGVRLTSQMDETGVDDAVQPSAVPVFIGWSESSASDDEPLGLIQCDASWVLSRPPGVYFDALRQYFDNGGERCYLLRLAPFPLTDGISLRALQAWWSQQLDKWLAPLLNEPSITLVAAPQLVGYIELAEKLAEDIADIGKPGDRGTAIAGALIAAWRSLLSAVTASRPDLFFVLDAPGDPAVAKTCIGALRGEQSLGELGQHAALYGPHLMTDYRADEGSDGQQGTLDGYRIVPPCGAVLGVMARTDAEAGVWKAPANETLLHVLKPEYRETQTSGWFDVSQVTINLIRSFPGRGTRIWGCRTLAGTAGTPFRYVQIRRMVTWIEANLREVCRFAVFEPNHEITWFQLRGLCTAWLRRVWLDGGLAGTDEASAYTVQVGLDESMTQADIDAGRLIVKIGVAVLHAAEFIEVNLVLKQGHAALEGAALAEDELA